MENSRLTLSVAAAMAMTLLSACADQVATHGHVLRKASIDDVRPGVATKQDVRAVLGTPTSEAALNGVPKRMSKFACTGVPGWWQCAQFESR